jgi:KaiC/GvpD/RAD55 family RecA-like ATPase
MASSHSNGDNGAQTEVDRIAEFEVDGVIELFYYGIGREDFQSRRVRKLRFSNHEKGYMAYKIENNRGIVISKEKEISV